LEYPFHKDICSHVKGEDLLKRLIEYGKNHQNFALFVTDENHFTFYAGSSRMIRIEETVGGFKKLEDFQKSSIYEVCGFLGYDLKNDLELLSSENPSTLDESESIFFEAEIRIAISSEKIHLSCVSKEYLSSVDTILSAEPIFIQSLHSRNPLPNISEQQYLQTAQSLQKHIQRGDIYEANYCIEFSIDAPAFDPYGGFYSIWKQTKAPFSVFAKLDSLFILSGSPERYLRREDQRLISQPIKGTSKRYEDFARDHRSMLDLQNDQKEQSENVMIVDLVRNDLSRVAARGSVKVSELFGIQTFKTVHHLVSTVEARLDDGLDTWDAIKATFPMGSMTGAPKISAMKLIEQHENFKRGVYSGAFGVINPDGNFDFNVLIRTLVYESLREKITFGVGSAITIMADSQREWNECMLKADALIKSLRHSDHEPKKEIQSQS